MIILLFQLALAEPNMARAIKESSSLKVQYDSQLGEGDNTWDPAPRIIEGTVNCMTWMQWVLARAYAPDLDKLPLYLDAIRYYEGTVSFATRKHYIDRWVTLEAGPLQTIDANVCQPDAAKFVALELDLFQQNHSYSCSLYREDVQAFHLSFMSSARTDECLMNIADGFYVMFFVANEQYLSRWGKNGAMGQVHSMILEKTGSRLLIHHASVDFGKVVSEEWSEFSTRIQNVSEGFTIYELDPNWQPSVPADSTKNLYLECEQALLRSQQD